jgi:hypothetical protein
MIERWSVAFLIEVRTTKNAISLNVDGRLDPVASSRGDTFNRPSSDELLGSADWAGLPELY